MKAIKQFLDMIYLALSECDGMCKHCNKKLQASCFERKNKALDGRCKIQ